MALPLETIRTHIAYSNWATNRLLAAAAALPEDERNRDFGTADKSICGTLTHLYQSERVWLERIVGAPRTPFKQAQDRQFEVVLLEWPRVMNQWSDWAASLTDESADQQIDYSDLKGNRWLHHLEHIVLHVVNHSTHHRGQVAGFLRALGKTPPVLDFIAYIRGLK